MDIQLERLKLLRLEPGDQLVYEVNAHLSAEQRAKICALLSEAVGITEKRVLVVESGTLKVIRNTETA